MEIQTMNCFCKAACDQVSKENGKSADTALRSSDVVLHGDLVLGMSSDVPGLMCSAVTWGENLKQ